MHYRTVEAHQNPMLDNRTGLCAAENVSRPDHQPGDLKSRQVDHYQHRPIIAQGLPARATTRPIVAAEGPHPDPGPIFLANQRVRSSSPSRVFDERAEIARP
jgi:hypothetical protein